MSNEKGVTLDNQKLSRSVPWWMLIPWLIGGVTGGDFYITNSFIVSNGGPLTVFGYLGAMIFVIIMSLVYWELVSTFPYSGGQYVFISRAFGKFPGFIVFFVYAFNFAFWIPLNLSVAGAYLNWIFPEIQISSTIWSIIIAVIFHLIVFRGILFSTLVQVVMSIVAITGTTLLVIVPMLRNPEKFLTLAATNLNSDFLFPTFDAKFAGFFALAGLTITYMVGFEIVPMLAEEIKSSRARLGYIQTMGSMGMGTVQILCALGMVTLIPYHMFASMANTEMNIPAAAMEMAPDLLPVFVVKIILGAAILSSFATCLSAITGFTRSIYVLGRDQRLPKVFSYLHPKYKTPVGSIVLCFVLGILGSIQREIVSYAFALVMAAMFMYILIPISHIILRKKEPNTIRPVKTPFYPIINIIASTWAAYMFYYQVKTVPITVWYFLFAVICLGIVFYFYYDKKRTVYIKAIDKDKKHYFGLPI
ncbi:MAG: APC family permease [Clostridia bacterium]|nr:APC family permease [Clostridia bacterium]